MDWLIKFWKFIKEFLTNPKNKQIIIFSVFILFGLLFFKQCNSIKNLKKLIKTEQAEQERIKNNFEASLDTIKTYKTKNGALRTEISGYTLTINELKKEYSDLFGEYEKEKNKQPKTIIKYNTEVVEVVKEIHTYVSIDSLGNNEFIFIDSANFGNGNKRIFSGNIPFKLNYFSLPDSILQHNDSISYFAEVYPGLGKFEIKQNISLITGLSIDNKTKKPLIWIETKYPGIIFSEISGAYIMDDPISRKVARNLRKEFGIGIQTGYGIMLSKTGYNTGIYVGVGISYTPKFLQFGK